MSLSALHLNGLGFAWPGQAPLFSDVTAVFSPGWTAIIGDNGIGKTTLTALMTGRDGLKPASGSIDPDPASGTLVTAWCPQEVTREPDGLEEFSQDWSSEAIDLRTRLDIGDDWPWRFDSLSGGEKKRLQLACALNKRPDLLLLDEPTNHLDLPSRRRLTQVLQGFRGIGVLISHDRVVLDALATSCLFLTRVHGASGTVTTGRQISGNYSQAHAQLVSDGAAQSRLVEQAGRQVRQLAGMEDAARRATAHAESRKSGAGLDPRDHDARARHKLAHMTDADAAGARAGARAQSRLRRAEQNKNALVEPAHRYDADVAEFFSVVEPSHRRVLAQLPAGSLDCGTGYPDLLIGPNDHIGLTGANGAGKTSLVHRLLEKGVEKDVPVLVLPQECGPEETAAAMERLRALPPDDRGRVLSGYARLNSDPDRLLGGAAPSPGELRKLLLCLGILADPPALIVADEPTNHLDLASVEALGAALAAFRGAVLLVSHDEAFLDACTQIRWEIDTDADGGNRLSVRL
jgi:macrolide transport system ATP-binding/permease protein